MLADLMAPADGLLGSAIAASDDAVLLVTTIFPTLFATLLPPPVVMTAPAPAPSLFIAGLGLGRLGRSRLRHAGLTRLGGRATLDDGVYAVDTTVTVTRVGASRHSR